ncbi:EthD family reductase [Rhizobium lentis]|uniref:EthD family reductase n=1 Tax=Rhizobium TaxID=379 RepID=UPI001C8320C0|nr:MULTISPECIES: EthD family reductase [Rhizobium]MBX5132393.1 EthD family reductase [Rhizobium lentis]MBX5213681.1 EthD family reductase [Rhizobium sp. NLR9a]MBX5219164.1 EthD family reductase [Rhizobium sp. NLR8a]MBX5275071.1 EthD family reductase [Rhizobium sp. NLR13a]MBX5281270.1 EthD family reductase [Rhizobium sp. NLR10a]
MAYAKRIGYLVRRDDLSLDQFHSHWLGTHAELCKKLPGLVRYATNLIDREKYPDAGWDGFSELWFDSVEAHDAAFASQEGRTLLADAPNFAKKLYGVLVTENQHIWP